jgi:hypothetical protein
VDDVLVLDAWYEGSARQLSAYYALGAGYHTVRVEFFERGGDAQMQLWWSK